MRFMSGTHKVCICFGNRYACVEGYIDANYARDLDKIRSMSSYVFMFIDGVLSWRS